MIVLGIDPGLVKTGWGIINKQGSSISYIASGLIKTNTKLNLPDRLAELHTELTIMIKEFRPETAAVEEVFLNANPKSTLKLGQARGIALLAPALLNVPTAEYATNKIKKSVVGVGHANKEQIQIMIRTLLPASRKVSEDEADALAVAITHAHHLRPSLTA